MTNSATSTRPATGDAPAGFRPWHFFVLLSMMAATAAVMVTPHTHPAALLLLSAAIIGAGFVGVAITQAVAGFTRGGIEPLPLPPHSRDELEREKALVLRAIKELEFDRAMGKVGEEDFTAIAARLRARAIALMQELDRTPARAAGKSQPSRPPEPAPRSCPACGQDNDEDARFCKACGSTLGAAS